MENKILTKKYYINGPNNVARLTNGKKIIYIFGDFHLNLISQTKCETDQNSLNFDQFMIKFMKNNKKEIYDLFIEGDVNDVKDFKHSGDHDNYPFRVNYLNEVRKVFMTNMKFDNNNKIIKSDKYTNFRFNWFDFRFSINQFNIFFNNSKNLLNLYNKNNINDLLNNLYSVLDLIKSYQDDKINKKFIYINKIFEKYNNDKIKKKINYIYVKYFSDNKCNDKINEIIEYVYNNLDLFKNKYINFEILLTYQFEIYKKLDKLDNYIINYFNLCDLYLLKRILDKNYTKKSIVYTGAAHMNQIIYFLVKYFDFNISHIYYLDPFFNSINDFEKYIKKNDYINESLTYITNQPDKIVQCVNLFNFPDNFL